MPAPIVTIAVSFPTTLQPKSSPQDAEQQMPVRMRSLQLPAPSLFVPSSLFSTPGGITWQHV